MSKLQCDIVTPERKFYSDTVEFVVFPASEGEMGVYEKHEPVVTNLKAGTVRINKQDAKQQLCFAIAGGYAQVDGEKVVILASRAADCAELDKQALEGELEDLHSRKEDESLESANLAYVNSEIAWKELLLSQN